MTGYLSADTYDDIVRFGEGRLAGRTNLRGSKQLICTVYYCMTRQKREDDSWGGVTAEAMRASSDHCRVEQEAPTGESVAFQIIHTWFERKQEVGPNLKQRIFSLAPLDVDRGICSWPITTKVPVRTVHDKVRSVFGSYSIYLD